MNPKVLKIMMKRFFIIYLILIAVMIISIQCNKACDKKFAIIAVTLKYSDDQPVILDDYTLFLVSKNQNISTGNSSWLGSYVIVDDSMQNVLENRREIIRFTGYLNDEIVCEIDVLVGADKCHVKYLGTEPLTRVIDGYSDIGGE